MITKVTLMQASPTIPAIKDGGRVIGYDLIHYVTGMTKWALSSVGHSHQPVNLTDRTGRVGNWSLAARQLNTSSLFFIIFLKR